MIPIRLGINIDHVATLRNARGGAAPDPLRAADLAIASGADGITAHLREDRRHIQDEDMSRIAALCLQRGKPLNFEMAVTDEMIDIASRIAPHAVCLVPERREEVTTEGGLDVRGNDNRIADAIAHLHQGGSRVSCFIEADPAQIEASAACGAAVIELHTGAYCDAIRDGRMEDAAQQLDRLRSGARIGAQLGLEVHAGHGLDFLTVRKIAAIPEIRELNIGHFLIGEAIFTGLGPAVSRMRDLMMQARVSG
jgi:pyridoxine 5-phosphate synthase